jgi:hypothetical protein
VWVFPAALAVHVGEEAALDFPGWARAHASADYRNRDFWKINAAGLGMTLATTWIVSRRPTRSIVFAYFATQLSQQIPWNAAFHGGTTIAWRTYSPGFATALLQVPIWHRLMRDARAGGLLSGRGGRAALGIGALIHGTAVARQVFHAGLPPAASSASDRVV